MKKTILAIALVALTNIHTSQAAPKPPAPFILKQGYDYNPARKYSKGLVVSYEGNAYVALRAVPAGYRPTYNSSNLWLRWPSALDLSAITNQATITILSQALGLESNSVAIGGNAGYTNQSSFAVAIGVFSGAQNQGTNSVAVGSGAGSDTQGNSATAIGRAAGESDQGDGAVAVGVGSGRSYQGTNSVAVGNGAATANQGDSATAIGYGAGYQYQGSYAVAIGAGAAQDHQPSNSIVINATGYGLNATTNGGLYVKPIRTTNSSAGLLPLYYNTNTGEIMVVTP